MTKMAELAGTISFLYKSKYFDNQKVIAYLGDDMEEKKALVADIKLFYKYEKNLKLYTDIEAFENWQESEKFDK
jgi:hypothetical protein